MVLLPEVVEVTNVTSSLFIVGLTSVPNVKHENRFEHPCNIYKERQTKKAELSTELPLLSSYSNHSFIYIDMNPFGNN